ncbi:hypothetical protein BD779DRAFT_1667319 [Infundibulicybe gibba]|nr:hypothetical protein BD779DRAFT_1667319 [Infundibulicybe gibba]
MLRVSFAQLVSSSRIRIPPLKYCQSRNVRTKGGTGFYTDPIRRDERLLKKLEAQLENVKAKIRREEAEAEELVKKQKSHGPRTTVGGTTLDNHNAYFWHKVLTAEDHKGLAQHGIYSLDELYSVYQKAETIMSQPPHPNINQLEPRLQLAHELYNSIPERLNQAGRAKARSPFGGWF